MKILVCVKQVPEATEVRVNPDTGTLNRAGVASNRPSSHRSGRNFV